VWSAQLCGGAQLCGAEDVRKQFVPSLMITVGAVALAVSQPAQSRAEGLNVIPPEVQQTNTKRHDRWQQQRTRRHGFAAADAPSSAASDHLYDFIEHMLGHGRAPAAALKKPTRHAARPTPKALAAKSTSIRTATPTVTPAISAPTASPVTTASIPHAEPTSATTTAAFPTAPAISFAAEKAQAGFDLVKLEMARRTYNEPQVAGERIFTTHPEWRVLERSQDAMEPAERAAADAAGFVANTYVNDITRTIVVAIAGSQELRRHLITSDIWQALIKAEAPQQFFMAKSYVRSVMQRYQAKGYSTECVGHSLGGGACAYVATELGLRAIVVNPIAAGKLQPEARSFVTNYVVDGDVAQRVYAARGNEFAGDLMIISDGQDERRKRIVESFGPLSGPILLIRALPDSVRAHRIDTALDQIGQFAETARPR
jgi:hypothetical protein